MDALETRAVFSEAAIEVRQDGREITGGYSPTVRLATIASTGRNAERDVRARVLSQFAIRAPEREIHLLAGHSYDKPLARKLNGSLFLDEADDALSFRALLPACLRRNRLVHAWIPCMRAEGWTRGRHFAGIQRSVVVGCSER